MLLVWLGGCAKEAREETPAPPSVLWCANPSPTEGDLPTVPALLQAFPVGSRVVARSDAGVVTLYGPDLREERVLTEGAAGIGRAGDDVLVARSDGTVATVSMSGRIVENGTLTGTPAWLGESAGRRMAVGLAGQGDVLRFDVLDVQGGLHANAEAVSTYSMGELTQPTTGFEDRGTLYLGWDWGEWGGALGRVHLAEIATAWGSNGGPKQPAGWATVASGAAVYGFARVGDEVWGHGGTMHMGLLRSWVATASNPSRALYDGGNAGAFSEATPPPPTSPQFPITHVLPGPDGAVTMLAFSDVWRTDVHLSAWKKVGDLDLWYQTGRPDAVGSYPAVTSAWRDNQGGITFATRLNGLCRWTNAAK